jgi:hypothetical protein
MEPTKELADELFRDKVRQARATSPEQRFWEGARLFDHVCRIMTDGIRARHPDASEEEVKKILFRQIEIARKLEQST